MSDQTQRLEIATVKAEIGSNILSRFANDALGVADIPTESGAIPSLKKVILGIENKASVATTIYQTTAAGLAATAEGGMFLVASTDEDEIYVVWRKVSGVAVDTGKRALSAPAIEAAATAAFQSAADAEASAIAAQSAAANAAAEFEAIFEADQAEREAEFNQLMLKSGYESVYLAYDAGVVVDRQSQLVQRNGELYRVMEASSIPLTLTGTWTTDALKLQSVGDAALRSALESYSGPSMLGYLNPNAGSVGRTLQSKLNDLYTMEDAGIVGNNTTNDSVALQRWVENIGRKGGGTARLTAGKTYYIPGTIIIPEFVQIDLNGCTLRGNRSGGATNSMFKTGYFDGGTLITNVGGPTDVVMLDGIRVFNGRIMSAYRGCEFTNANRTCGIEGVTFTGCVQSWLLTRCWSTGFRNCFTDTASVFSIPSYKFVDSINAIVLDQVRAVTDFAFEFSGGVSGSGSVVFLNCDVEGSGNRAFYFQGQFHAITWIGGYFEGIPGVVFDFADVTQATVTWIGTFNYAVKTLLREPSSPTSTLDGEWNTSNAILGITSEYPATFNMQHPRNRIKVRAAGNFDSTTVLPANFITGGSPQADIECISTRLGAGPGDVLSKAVCSAGIVPLHFSGDVGRTFPNQVAFATHQAFQPGVSSIAILVTTKIAWRPDTAFVKYRFSVTDSGGPYILYGDVYGGAVKVQDGTGKTVTAENAGGFLRLVLSGFTHPTGVYTCAGTVQLLT